MKRLLLLLTGFQLLLYFPFATSGWAQESLPEDEDFLFELDLEALMDIEVESVTLTKQSLLSAPAVVTVFTASDLETYQYNSVADCLKLTPGFDILYDLAFYNAGVRGVNGGMGAQSQVIKTMIDRQDVSFRSTTGGFLGPPLIPTLAINRIEIIRGPLSALYGANAFLGLINVVPKSASDMQDEDGNLNGMSTMRGSYLNYFGNNGASTELATWGMPLGIDTFIALSYQSTGRGGLGLPETSPLYSDRREDKLPLSVESDTQYSTSGYAKFEGGNEAEAGKFLLDTNLQLLDRDGNFQPDSDPLSGSRLSYYNGMARIRHKKKFQNGFRLNTSLAYTRGAPTNNERLYYEGQRKLKSSAFDSRFEVNYVPEESESNLTAILGADLSLDQEELPSVLGFVSATSEKFSEIVKKNEASLTNVGGFGQLTWNPVEKLGTIAGLRFENHSEYGNQLSYRTGAVYSFSDHTVFKALLGRSFKAPAPSFASGQPMNLPFLVLFEGVALEEKVSPQYAITGEIFFGTRLTDLNIGVNVYYSRITDFAEFKFSEMIVLPYPENSANINAIGGEIELKFVPTKIPNLSAFANLSYVHTDQSSKEEASFKRPLFAHSSGNFGASYDWEKSHLRFFAIGRFIGKRLADKYNIFKNKEDYDLPGYSLLDVGISSLDIKIFGEQETRFTLKCSNLLGQQYVEPGFLGIDVPGLGRQVVFRMEQNF
ncbi:MAG TPA: hypothetical protein EYN69_11640 [Flavobacteriales bacterium]|nr:hypothetical protein [Flavobacteriales bacterium]